nr:MAG TPA: hypothetical protein [Caudoviricetes sp.]DAL67943.1 MAG TPA: hypothetical protein [Caudoviricetes sp.]
MQWQKCRKPSSSGWVFAYLCFVLAWPSSADTTSRTLGVPFIDGLRQPAPSAAYGRVGFGEFEVEQAAAGDAEAFGDLFDAEVFSRHCCLPCR